MGGCARWGEDTQWIYPWDHNRARFYVSRLIFCAGDPSSKNEALQFVVSVVDQGIKFLQKYY